MLISGVAMDSRHVYGGDLYAALPGAVQHGATHVAAAITAGAVAILTDPEGARIVGTDLPVPVIVVSTPRKLVGELAAAVYGTRSASPTLFGVTGTNGKTTTTYFINSLLAATGRSTGLIGTIEILAGGEPIPSALTTPESPQVHGLLALMKERGIDAASMEVSSHALHFHRVDAVKFDVVGFTNLTQDHLDLHETMDDYFATKSQLFRGESAQKAVVIIDDDWGRKVAEAADSVVTTLATQPESAADADWVVENVLRQGLGHTFTLTACDGRRLNLRTGLPGRFNVANAALAATMVLTSGVPVEVLQEAADQHDPFTVEVPGRMQLIGEAPAAIVDFAHNTDALALTLEAVRRPEKGSRVIVVFGATGQRDALKRPMMGEIAASLADVVVITDDDPHDEDAASIRADVLAGAKREQGRQHVPCIVEEVFPRQKAIRRAVALANEVDTILIAGRGHEVWQEIKGENQPLDDRVELRAAMEERGFNTVQIETVES
ncbi:UDP-N-acetylmuramoyl-L-alanyl-D-glutamate--2,6-diaminopimelate ligase [Arthrobacter roseus]